MIDKIKKWFKRQATAFALATASVEKDSLKQSSIELEGNIGQVQRHNQGTLADALDRGEITQEVKELRWRLFKVLEASDKMVINSLSVDDEGYHDLNVKKSTSATIKSGLKKIKLDTHDDYPLEMVINNKEVTLSGIDIISNDNIKEYDLDERVESVKSDDESKSATLGEISNDDYHSNIKTDKPIKIIRDLRPKFELESFTNKLNIRIINDKERLLEFYVSIYPDEYDRKTRLFLSEVKKAIKNPRASNMLDIIGVGFTSYKDIGVKDFHQFHYEVKEFDKIVQFDGYYVIKFKSEVILNGEYLLEKYRLKELDQKYKNKESKR